MKRALITGASSGIGFAASKLFLEKGWTVIMMDKAKDEKEIEEIESSHKGKAFFYQGDVSRNDDVMLLFDYALDKTDGVDCIVNNAGIIAHGYLHEVSEPEWDSIFNTDVRSIYLTSKFFVPDLIKKGGGTIVNTASISGIAADYKMPVYNAAKGAVVNLTRAMALDYGEFNIRVNSVCPGATDTPMLRSGSGDIEEYAKANPLKRICKPEEVAKAILFLASDESSYCNGVNLPVTGGLEVHTGQPKS